MRIPKRLRALHLSRVLVLSLAALATGCGDAWEDSPASRSSQPLTSLPASCQDIKAANPEAPDGEYTLYLGGNETLPWSVWCHGMAGTPSEFLSLARTGADINYSQYTAGGSAPGTTVRTTYTRLRIDPTTLRVSTADQTFASSVGALNHGSTRVTSMPYGVAMNCILNSSVSPANLDLRGTPFTVAPSQFGLGGGNQRGTTTYSEAKQVVTLTGGGNCGWNASVGSFNPFNQNGAQLQLRYRAAHLPETCQDIKNARPEAQDGEYALYVDKDPSSIWSAWCHDMAGTPAEYLGLIPGTAASNYSQYTAGGSSPGTDVRTTYFRLRIDPLTLRANTADQTFSYSTGALTHGSTPVTSMPYGVAMGCSRLGVGNVDLRGTPFAVASGQFRAGGVSISGASFPYSAGNQVVSLTGSGYCGWVGPLDSFNPFNQNGKPLQLFYSGVL